MASFGIGGAFDVEADVVVLVVVFLKIVKDARRGTICLVRRGDVCDHVLSEVVGIFILSIAANHFVLCLFIVLVSGAFPLTLRSALVSAFGFTHGEDGEKRKKVGLEDRKIGSKRIPRREDMRLW